MNTKQVKAYGAETKESDLKPMHIPRRDPQAHDVELQILFCGVCHSDLHTAKNDWGMTQYPVVPGHEIVGKVTRIGSATTKHAVGDTVAVGCLVDSCRTCGSCKNDLEQYCPARVGTYGGHDTYLNTPTHGGYSNRIVVHEDFVLRVPNNLDLAGLAPVLCAGITSWSPLRHWKVGKGSHVAVVGLGGLGHMALKLAHALGARVTLFSRSAHKMADAKALGADEVIISTDDAQMKKAANQFDLIIDTVPYAHDLNPYVGTLAINGTLVIVGYLGPLDPMLATVPMITGRRSVAGSLIGGIAETQELLDFCGEHNITSDIEVIPMQEINTAYERMLKSDVKYRFVIDMESL